MIQTLFRLLSELAARVTIGWVFIESGWGKLHSLPKVIAYFESLNIPAANIQAPMVAVMEFSLGAFVLAGFCTRLSSLPLIGIMIVAIRTAKWDEVSDFSSLTGISEFLYIVILLLLLANGSRYFALDWLLKKQIKNRVYQWNCN